MYVYIYIIILYYTHVYTCIHTNIHPPHFQTQPATSHSAVIQHRRLVGRSR